MRRFTACILVICALSLLLVSCGADPIVGTWTGMWDGSDIEITFEEDGVCGYKMDGRSYLGKWEKKDGCLTVTIDEVGETRVFVEGAPCEVKGDTLTVTVRSKTVKLTKQQ